MGIGSFPGHAALLAVGVVEIMWLGLLLSGYLYVSFTVSQKICGFFGWETIRPDRFKLYFDQFMDLLLDPIGRRVSVIDQSSKTTTVVYQLALGVVVLVLIVVLQVSSMLTVTGVALAGYHFFGATFELMPVLNSVAATCVFLAIVLMSYGNQRIEERTPCA